MKKMKKPKKTGAATPGLARNRYRAPSGRSIFTVGVMAVAVMAAAMLSPVAAHAYFFSKDLEAYGYFQGWYAPYESMENMSVVSENGYLSGFSLNKVRAGVNAWFLDRKLGVFFQATFYNPVGILDASLIGKPIPEVGIQFGQFKIPSTFENLLDDRKLDFIMRSKISGWLADYSLLRNPYPDSKYNGYKSNLRDMGIALKADAPIPYVPMKFFLMIGNGLGANNMLMGDYERGLFVTNAFGQYFYGFRMELLPWDGNIIIGGDYNRNYHDNMAAGDGSKTTVSIDRQSWEVDLQLAIPGTGLKIGGIYGSGWIHDSEEATHGANRSDYSGGMAQVVWSISGWLMSDPAFSGRKELAFMKDHGFDIVYRWEGTYLVKMNSGRQIDYYNTAGVNYRYKEYVKVMFNWINKWAAGDKGLKIPDLNENGFLLCLQGAI